MTGNINHLAKQIKELHKQAYDIYLPEVDFLINNAITDDNAIECLLDRIFDFCSDEKMLALFKKLCRYYFTLNPQATTTHIDFYRKMWDNEKDVDSGTS
jgi:hypothetical protein